MPTRLLREGILSSDRVDQLGPEAEVFYRRLMSKVDDFGLFDARPGVLRTSLYPLRVDRTTENNCEQWLTDCINAKLLVVYQIDGKPYLKMLDTKWKARAEPKYPQPLNGCKQLKAPVYLDVVVDVVRSRLIEVVDVGVTAPKSKAVENTGTSTPKPSPTNASDACQHVNDNGQKCGKPGSHKLHPRDHKWYCTQHQEG